MNFDNFFKYVFSAVISICGFLIVSSYNRVNLSIEKLNVEVMQLKMQLVDINSKIVDEEKVKEIVRDELLKHGIRD